MTETDFSVQNKKFLSIARQFGFGRKACAEDSSIISNSNVTSSSSTGNSNNKISRSSINISAVSSKSGWQQSNNSKSFNEVILELLQLQEDIGKLQSKEKQFMLSEQYEGLTNPVSSLQWLLQDLQDLSTNLSYILDNSARIQLKLANPAISNSLPLHSSLHEPLVDIAGYLKDIVSNSER